MRTDVADIVSLVATIMHSDKRCDFIARHEFIILDPEESHPGRDVRRRHHVQLLGSLSRHVFYDLFFVLVGRSGVIVLSGGGGD